VKSPGLAGWKQGEYALCAGKSLRYARRDARTDKRNKIPASKQTKLSLIRQVSRMNDEIERLKLQLADASRHKAEFLAIMSHELRTPLNAVIGFSDVLEQRMAGELNEKQVEFVQDIRASGRHLLGLINDILDLSTIEAGRMELDPTAFDLAESLRCAMALVREQASAHRIALELDIAPGVGTVVADERKVRQVALHLLTNAVKFTPDGGRLALDWAIRDRSVEIRVIDSGIGVPRERLESIFEPFVQVDTSLTRVHHGTGLGLAISRELVRGMGGDLRVESAPDAGSTFTVTLPSPVE
jgi:signal transduction histidine kinase